MSTDTLIVIAFLFFGLLILFLLIKSQISQPKVDPTLNAWLKSLQQSFDTTNKTTTASLQQNYKELFTRLDQATSVIGDLKKEAGAFGEVSRSMKDLQDYLKSPKLRGNIGEQVLTDLIAQMFPKSGYVLQHHFKSGQIVDAAIKTQAGILPIDSKFPMENFQKIYQSTTQLEKVSARSAFVRDVKKHIKDISGKYILPDEGTLDFAVMYIPSEPVYYEIVNETEIMDLSKDARVFPVSPTTFYTYLRTILLSLEGQKIAGKTAEVFSLLRAVQKDYEKLNDNFSLLNKHLTNAYSTMNTTSQTMNQIGNKLESAHGLKSGLDKNTKVIE